MKRIIICNLPKTKEVLMNDKNYDRTMVVIDQIQNEDITLCLKNQHIFRFLWKRTGYTIIKLLEKSDGRFHPLMMNKKQINKIKKKYPEYYI